MHGFYKHLIFVFPGVLLLAVGLAPWIPGRPAHKLLTIVTLISPKTFSKILFFTCLLAGLSINLVLLDGIPHIQDSIAQVFQAKIFAHGRLWVPAPPAEFHDFFDMEFIIQHAGKMYGKYNPGFAAVLTPFLLFGIPWLCVPLSGAFALVLLYRLVRSEFTEGIARAVSLLGLVSPFFLGLAGSFMNHTPSLLASIVMLTAWSKGRKHHNSLWGLILGVAVVSLMLKRRLTALCLFAPMALFMFIGAWKQKTYRRQLILTALPLLIALVLLGTYFYLVNGSPLVSGYKIFAPEDTVGFGPNIGLRTFNGGKLPGHSFQKALNLIRIDLLVLSENLFGWPSLSLLFFVIALFRKQKSDFEKLLALQFFTVLLGYSCYWCDGICFGARYLYETLPSLLILSVLGIRMTLHLKFFSFKNNLGLPIAAVFLFLLFSRSIFLYSPRLFKTYSHSYWHVDRKLERMTRDLKNAVVFVQSSYYRKVNGTGADYYGAAVLLNRLDLNGPVIYVRDLGTDKNKLFMQQYPHRKPYFFKYREMLNGKAVPGEPVLVPYVF